MAIYLIINKNPKQRYTNNIYIQILKRVCLNNHINKNRINYYYYHYYYYKLHKKNIPTSLSNIIGNITQLKKIT